MPQVTIRLPQRTPRVLSELWDLAHNTLPLYTNSAGVVRGSTFTHTHTHTQNEEFAHNPVTTKLWGEAKQSMLDLGEEMQDSVKVCMRVCA